MSCHLLFSVLASRRRRTLVRRRIGLVWRWLAMRRQRVTLDSIPERMVLASISTGGEAAGEESTELNAGATGDLPKHAPRASRPAPRNDASLQEIAYGERFVKQS